jgi:hypothetical protein
MDNILLMTVTVKLKVVFKDGSCADIVRYIT